MSWSMLNSPLSYSVWGEILFKKTFETVWQIVQGVVSHQKTLPLFRKITTLSIFTEIGDTDPYTNTRYGTRVFMGCRLLVPRRIYKNRKVDTEMEVWLERQKPDTHQKFKKVINVVLTQTDSWKNLDLYCQTFDELVHRRSDNMFCVSVTVWKVTPAILYNMCEGLDNLYSEPIDGLDESIRKKVNVLFMERWNTFHVPMYSVSFLMDNTFCLMSYDSSAKLELI